MRSSNRFILNPEDLKPASEEAKRKLDKAVQKIHAHKKGSALRRKLEDTSASG